MSFALLASPNGRTHASLAREGQQPEDAMIRVKVEYDKYNRTFKLLDCEIGSALEDGGIYELEVPLIVEGITGSEDFALIGAPLAHA